MNKWYKSFSKVQILKWYYHSLKIQGYCGLQIRAIGDLCIYFNLMNIFVGDSLHIITIMSSFTLSKLELLIVIMGKNKK